MKCFLLTLIVCAGIFPVLGCMEKTKAPAPEMPAAPVSEGTETVPAQEAVPAPEVVELDAAGFEAFIQDPGRSLVVIHATWCPPCRMLEKLLHEMETDGRLPKNSRIGLVDGDKEQELAERFQIEAFPTLLIFRNGTLEDRLLGYQDEQTILGIFAETKETTETAKTPEAPAP
ncbi:MAG: thioredoxin family protein [Planctomycetaceae bacterium]|nr:thioredoxin family protein [Planctomycetaceae bacterium]